MAKQKSARILNNEDREAIYKIMKKYINVNRPEKSFLEEELAIDEFFRHVQTEVSGEAANEKYGTGDHGGFFFTKEKN